MLAAIIGWSIIGIIVGWLGGLAVGGSGFGVLGDMAIGLLGALIGGWIVHAIPGTATGANGGFLWSLVVAFVGAVLLLLVARAISGGTRARP